MSTQRNTVELTGALLDQGQGWRGMRRQERAGALVRIRHGAYTGELDDDRGRRHRQLIEATLPRLAPAGVLSHASAAVLHGLPLWDDTLRRVHVTRARTSGGRCRPRLWVHTGPLEAEDVTVIDGVLVTGLARTVADLARTLPLGRAVAVADAGLRLGLDPGRLDAEGELAQRRRGARQLRFVTGFADPRAESPGESESRLLIHQARLPAPELQYAVVDPDTGEIVAYCDFGWADRRTVGEFDGLVKYGRILEDWQEPGDVVYSEKVREDQVRWLRHEVVRWTSADLSRPRLFTERLWRAFERGLRLH